MGNQIRYLIPDTNIIQYAGSKPENRALKVANLILSKEKQSLTKAISLITCYEAVQRRNFIQEREILQKLNLYTQLEADRKVYLFAGWLSDFYRNEGIPESQLDDCDQVIAATCILTTSLLLTENRRDFPSPFFNEIENFNIYYTNKGREQIIKIYLLQPDVVILNKYIRERKESR